MGLMYVLALVVLFAMTFNNAFSNASPSSLEIDSLVNVVKSRMIRREEYDPYGFNSILSRYYKRSKFDEITVPDELNFFE
ncbi:unnamed protein product [Adineta ricciae]|uniref:Uncharacterized protein n=1 Tax=Adineta ricciae TaxID=249248 RepID=A0A815DQR8_ADIRI|nr:unnamed protein product [Adineta ricciae]CAF1596074.1 unnamed protein product [Adineta ricciae]